MSIDIASSSEEFNDRDVDQRKYNYLQLKVMEAMGFRTRRSELDWAGQKYSNRYSEIFARKKTKILISSSYSLWIILTVDGTATRLRR